MEEEEKAALYIQLLETVCCLCSTSKKYNTITINIIVWKDEEREKLISKWNGTPLIFIIKVVRNQATQQYTFQRLSCLIVNREKTGYSDFSTGNNKTLSHVPFSTSPLWQYGISQYYKYYNFLHFTAVCCSAFYSTGQGPSTKKWCVVNQP